MCELSLLGFHSRVKALPGASTNRRPEARLDICARGFWSPQQDAFFVRVTHPSASLLSRAEVLAPLTRNEQQKNRAYLQRVIHVERGAFTRLVFAINGICGQECSRARFALFKCYGKVEVLYFFLASIEMVCNLFSRRQGFLFAPQSLTLIISRSIPLAQCVG